MANVDLIYKRTKKLVEEFYFGDKKQPKNPFRNCKNNADIFNLNRRIIYEKKQMLNRILILVNYDSKVRLKGP